MDSDAPPIDRHYMMLLGQESIRDAIPLPAVEVEVNRGGTRVSRVQSGVPPDCEGL